MSKSKRSYILYGILGIIILSVGYWGLNYLKGSALFSKNYTYYVYYDRIEGLNASSPVIVKGFKIGQVTDIKFLPQQNQQLIVTLEITNEFLLPDSTIARITSMDLLGSKGIELIFNDNASSYHEPDDILIGEVEQSLKEQVSVQMLPIKQQGEQLMKELSNVIEIITYIFNEDTRANLEKSIASIKTTLSYIEHAAFSVDTLLSSESRKISGIISNIEILTSTLSENKDNVNYIFNNLSDFSDSLRAINLSKTLVEIDNVLMQINEAAEKINKGEGSLGQLINDDAFIKGLEEATNSLDRLINDVRIDPKKYVNFSLLKLGRTINVVDESELSPKDWKRLEKQRKKEKEKEDNLSE